MVLVFVRVCAHVYVYSHVCGHMHTDTFHMLIWSQVHTPCISLRDRHPQYTRRSTHAKLCVCSCSAAQVPYFSYVMDFLLTILKSRCVSLACLLPLMMMFLTVHFPCRPGMGLFQTPNLLHQSRSLKENVPKAVLIPHAVVATGERYSMHYRASSRLQKTPGPPRESHPKSADGYLSLISQLPTRRPRWEMSVLTGRWLPCTSVFCTIRSDL